MTRHSKNSCAGPVFTYSERQRTNWGTQSARINSHAIKPFDCCAICLHAAVDAVVCQKGHLYCKECIYESLLQQKERQKDEQAVRDDRERRQRLQEEQKQQEHDESDIHHFIQTEQSIFATPATASSASATSPTTAVVPYEAIQTSKGTAYIPNKSAATHSTKPLLPSFWVPSLTPSTTDTARPTVPPHTVCPAGQHRLRLRQLRPLRFTLSPSSSATGTARPSCPSCQRDLTNASRPTALYACGHVVCGGCVAATRDGVEGGVECVECGRESGAKEQVALETGTGHAGSGGGMAVAQTMPAFVC